MASYLIIKSVFASEEVKLGPGNQQEMVRLAAELHKGGMNQAEFYLNGSRLKFADGQQPATQPSKSEVDKPSQSTQSEKPIDEANAPGAPTVPPSREAVPLAQATGGGSGTAQHAPDVRTTAPTGTQHREQETRTRPPMGPPSGPVCQQPARPHAHVVPQANAYQHNGYHAHNGYQAPPNDPALMSGYPLPGNGQTPINGYRPHVPTNGSHTNGYQPQPGSHVPTNGSYTNGPHVPTNGPHTNSYQPPHVPTNGSHTNGPHTSGHQPQPGPHTNGYQPPPGPHGPTNGHPHANDYHASPGPQPPPHGHPHTGFPNSVPVDPPYPHRPLNTSDIVMLQQHEALMRSLQATAQHHEQITEVNSRVAAERLTLFRLRRAQDAADIDNMTNQLHLRRMQLQVDDEEWSQAQRRAAAGRPSGFDTFLESLANLVAVHTQAVIIPKVDK